MKINLKIKIWQDGNKLLSMLSPVSVLHCIELSLSWAESKSLTHISLCPLLLSLFCFLHMKVRHICSLPNGFHYFCAENLLASTCTNLQGLAWLMLIEPSYLVSYYSSLMNFASAFLFCPFFLLQVNFHLMAFAPSASSAWNVSPNSSYGQGYILMELQ